MLIDVERDKQTRDEVSAALVALRQALGKTQQTFAVEVLKNAISTIARWETSDPPRGEVLLQLAKIAEKNRLMKLQDIFLRRYVDEAMQKTKFDLLFDPETRSGCVWVKFQGQKQLELANKFLSDLAALKKAGRS